MKTLTLACNFVMLALVAIGLLTSGPKLETETLLDGSLGFVVVVLNIIMITGSTIRRKEIPDENLNSTETKGGFSVYIFLKICAIILNLTILTLVFIKIKTGYGIINNYYKAFLITTFVTSLAIIAIGRWNRFKGFIKPVLTAGIIVTLLFTGTFFMLRTMVRNGIREHISIAKSKYQGNAEDALLAYLADSTNSPRDRTNIAVWTLGQIRSWKALPVLYSLYRNDPEGLTCNHSTECCQYEIHKAIVSIERNWMGSREKNLIGSWSKFNQ